MPDDRENLIRKNFELERDLHYPRFRREHWNDREIVEKCQNPAEREAMLCVSWKEESEKCFAGYREGAKDMSTSQLLGLRADLIEQSKGLTEWQQTLAECARVPANDNEPERDR